MRGKAPPLVLDNSQVWRIFAPLLFSDCDSHTRATAAAQPALPRYFGNAREDPHREQFNIAKKSVLAPTSAPYKAPKTPLDQSNFGETASLPLLNDPCWSHGKNEYAPRSYMPEINTGKRNAMLFSKPSTGLLCHRVKRPACPL